MKENQLLENPEAFIYLDPPYLEGLRCDGKLYQVDMPDVRDHINLLKAICQAKSKIVLSRYWSGHDDGSDLYDYYLIPHGWHRHLLGEYAKSCEVGESKSKGLVTFPTGLYKADGKREYVYKYAATQAEASEELRRLQAEKDAGVFHGKSAIKTGEWVNTWIEKCKAPNLAPATLSSYRNNFRVHIEPAIGEIKLRDLTHYHIQRMLDNVGGSFSLFVKVYNVLHGALGQAVELGMIPRNPCKGVTFPKDDTEEMRVLTPEEQQKFIEELDGEYYRPMLLMYLYTGLRLGEGIPLTWEDIDLAKRIIRVNKKAIVCHDFNSHSAPQVVQNFCKTKSSKRKVVITAGLVGVLKVHKAEMMERTAQLGEEWSESNLVFLNTRGNMVYGRNLQESLYKIFARAGIKGATMHPLRHTYATRCFEAGVDIKAVSEQLGHKNVKTTYNIYVHLLEDTKEKEIDKLDDIDKLLA